MPANIPRVRPGEPITAAHHNRLVDAINSIGKISVSPPLEMSSSFGGTHLRIGKTIRNQHWVPFQNDSGGEAPAFGLLAITGVSVRDGRPILDATQPNTAYRRVYAVNGPTNIPDGESGLCTFDTPVICKFDSGSTDPVFGEEWGPNNGSWDLNPNRQGFTTIGTVDTTNSYAYVLRNSMDAFIGKTNAQLDPGDTSVGVSLFTGSAGNEADDTDFNVNVSEWMLQTGEAVETSKECICLYVNGVPYIIAAECPSP